MELTIQNLSKTYGNKVALREFSYTFTPGIYGILGANGAGKSTLIRWSFSSTMGREFSL